MEFSTHAIAWKRKTVPMFGNRDAARADPFSLRRRAGRVVLDRGVRPTLRRFGLYLLTDGYSTPIPNVESLKARGHWDTPSSMVGIDLRQGAQLGFLRDSVRKFASEPPFQRSPAEAHRDGTYHLDNGSFGSLDAAALHAFVRTLRPRHVVEVGCGNSTLLFREGLAMNAAQGAPPAHFLTIDPFPPERIFNGHDRPATIIQKPVQDAGLAPFADLGPGDILFVDSSHVAKAGSDVNWLVLEVVPRLAPGVFVHFHDIFLPYEYGLGWFGRPYQFWSEQYLLHALLAHSPAFQVEWMSYYLHRRFPEELEALVPFYSSSSQCPASFWIRRK